MCVYIQERGFLIEEATVMKVQDRSFDVLVERLGIDERVLLDNMDGLQQYRFFDASRYAPFVVAVVILFYSLLS